MRAGLAGVSVLTLSACGGGWEAPKTPSASNFDLTVGNTVSKTVAQVASLANVANFTPTSLTTTNGTYANCTYDGATNTLTVTPKTPDIEAPTDTCTATLVDATGAKLWPITLGLKSLDNKAPVFASTLTTPIAISAGTAGSITLPRATDANPVTYGIKLSNGSPLPADLSFDPTTSQLSWTTATTADQSLEYTATDAYSNPTTMSLSTAVDHPGSASITGPTSSGNNLTLTLSWVDTDWIKSYRVTQIRVRTTGVQDPEIDIASWNWNPPPSIDTTMPWIIGSKWIYKLYITDNKNNETVSSPLTVDRI